MGTFTVLSVIMPALCTQEYDLFFLILKVVTTNPKNCTTRMAYEEFKYFGTKEIFPFTN